MLIDPGMWFQCFSFLDGEALEVGDTLTSLCAPGPSVGPVHGRDSECWLNLINLNGIELYYIFVYVIHICILSLSPPPLLLSLYIYIFHIHMCMRTYTYFIYVQI